MGANVNHVNMAWVLGFTGAEAEVRHTMDRLTDKCDSFNHLKNINNEVRILLEQENLWKNENDMLKLYPLLSFRWSQPLFHSDGFHQTGWDGTRKSK